MINDKSAADPDLKDYSKRKKHLDKYKTQTKQLQQIALSRFFQLASFVLTKRFGKTKNKVGGGSALLDPPL